MIKDRIEGRIHSIESFGTVDGPGIRYVVYFQGCGIRCAYCHNPDTWDLSGGRICPAESLIEDALQYKEFTKRGGVTATGGEPLLQIAFLTELFRLAKENQIHTCLDTSGIPFHKADRPSFDKLMELTDLVILDIKHMREDAHRKLTGCSNQTMLAFAKYLMEIGKDTWIRRVLVPGMTDQPEELYELGAFIAMHNNIKALDLLPYHAMGIAKYQSLEIAYPIPGTREADASDIMRAKKIVLRAVHDIMGENRK